MSEPGAQGSRSAQHVVVTAPAELDVASAADLSSCLKAACEATDMITVDMTATTFCDMTGVRALRRARDLAKANRGELRLASSCPACTAAYRPGTGRAGLCRRQAITAHAPVRRGFPAPATRRRTGKPACRAGTVGSSAAEPVSSIRDRLFPVRPGHGWIG